MNQIRLGQALLIICCIFYLIWWCVAFHPNHGNDHISGVNGILLFITVAFGLTGLTFNMLGMLKTPPGRGLMPGIVIVVAGVALYAALLYVSRIFLQRQVTSELFLIIGWAMLEVASINRAFAWERVTADRVIIFLIIVAVAVVLSLFFYLQYYKVEPMTGYFYGMVPLVTEGICMGIFEIFTK